MKLSHLSETLIGSEIVSPDHKPSQKLIYVNLLAGLLPVQTGIYHTTPPDNSYKREYNVLYNFSICSSL
ncbi:MAG: hypothetical protein SGI96_03575 [Bacteroidota bacterium]|nr:hypothetical protein [Bacteroidota bacterium]